jgi:heat-inducible transcriptional repressor
MDFRFYNIPEERNLRVLESVIRLYTEQAEPVSSSAVTRDLSHCWSSATIRKVFLELEEVGWLMQPYTSAGRIPTDLGFRVYVEKIVRPGQEERPLDALLEAELSMSEGSLPRLLDQSLTLLSKLSHAMGLSLLVISQEMDLSEDRFSMTGVNQLLNQPEFDDPGRLKVLIQLMEDATPISGHLRHLNCGPGEIILQIGGENALGGLENFSLVTTRINREGETALMGVLGPVRMEYPLVLGAMSSLVHLLHDDDSDNSDSWS